MLHEFYQVRVSSLSKEGEFDGTNQTPYILRVTGTISIYTVWHLLCERVVYGHDQTLKVLLPNINSNTHTETGRT